MKRASVGILAAVLTLTMAADAFAQCSRGNCRNRSRTSSAQRGLPLTIDARLDAGIPLGDDEDELDTGLGWGVGASMSLTPTFAVYGEYSRFNFEFEGTDVDFDSDGFGVGARMMVGTGGGFWSPYVQFGALFHDDDTGFEAGLGADYAAGGNLSVLPLVRYRSVDGFEYLTLGFGVSIRL